MNELLSIGSQLFGMVPHILRALPALLAYLVIAQLAYGRFKSMKQPIPATDAAYILIAVAAFTYVVK